MFNRTTDNWMHFIDSNPNVSTVMADTLPVQLELMQKGYADGLVGQLPYAMGYEAALKSADVLEKLGQGIPLAESQDKEIIVGTHQLEVLRVPSNPNRTILPMAATDLAGQGIQVEEKIVGVKLLLDGAKEMSLQETVMFEQLTEDWFEGFFRRNPFQAVDIGEVKTSISVERQDVTDSGNTITVDQTIAYLALDGALEPEDYLIVPYLHAQENRDFATALAARIGALEGVQSPIGRPFVENNESDDVRIGLIIGLSVAATVVTMAIAAWAYQKYGTEPKSPPKSHPNDSTPQEDADAYRSTSMETAMETDRPPTVLAVAEVQLPPSSEQPLADHPHRHDGLPSFKDQVRFVPRPRPSPTERERLPVIANAKPINDPVA